MLTVKIHYKMRCDILIISTPINGLGVGMIL